VSGACRDAWRVVGASVRGSGHEKTNLPCQDAHAHQVVEGDWVVAAAADGAGSAPLAEVGARVAADYATAALADRLRAHLSGASVVAGADGWRDALTEVLRRSRAAVEEEARTRQRSSRELASTLLLMLLGPTATMAAQIGDGAMVTSTEAGAVEALTRPPQGGEYANETVFLTAPRALEAVQFAYREAPVASAAALTDGLQRLAFTCADWTPFAPFFQPVFSYFRQEADGEAAQAELSRMLVSPEVRRRTDDDVTLLVASRRRAS
jgi:hypothetical protein